MLRVREAAPRASGAVFLCAPSAQVTEHDAIEGTGSRANYGAGTINHAALSIEYRSLN